MALTEIDMLHVRKDEVLDGATTLALLKPTDADSTDVVVAPSPDACLEVRS